MAIHQGDQYYLPVIIKQGQTPVTPEDVTDVRIKLGNHLKSYSAGELAYDDNGRWLYALTEEMTREITFGYAKMQVGLKIGDNIIYSDVTSVEVSYSSIKEDWMDG